MTIRVAVVGATGRLGAQACALVREADDLELVAELDSRSALGELLGPESAPSDVVVDMTAPAVSGGIVRFALEHDRKVLVGTSGWSAERIAELAVELRDHPERGIVIVPNFSVGSVLASSFAAQAARFFDSVEIIEAHHAAKQDSPSGTATRTAELIAAARSELGPVDAAFTDQRARGQQVASVPVHSLRMTGVVARQEVLLGGPGERIVIAHETVDVSSYRAGIVLGIRRAATTTGMLVGLDRLLDL